MEECATQRWRRWIGLYEFDMQTSGPFEFRMSRRERARRIRITRALIASSRQVAVAADALGIDATAMLHVAAALARSLDEAEANPLTRESDPGWWNSETVAGACVVADHLDIRDSHPKPPLVPSAVNADPRLVEQDRLLDTAFGRAALLVLASTHRKGPGACNSLSAFNGCGGVRWNPTKSVDYAETGYHYARHKLSAMAACGLIEKPTRGKYRILPAGLERLASQR